MKRWRRFLAYSVLLAVISMISEAASDFFKVGCFYFPGWYCADRWVPIKEYGSPQPLLGYYRDDSPKVQDWHIRWARQHGISFWVFDWYYDHKTGTVSGHNGALDKGFLNASRRNEMEFAIMWCNEETGAPTYTEEEMLRLVHMLSERYLCQRNYLRVVSSGRCMLIFSRPLRIVERFGVSGTRALFHKMNQAAKAYGGLFFVANADPAIADLSRLYQAGFNACTLYCYSTQGMRDSQAKEAPYDAILPMAEEMWCRAKETKTLKIIPTMSPGWDSRPWYGESALIRTGSTPEKFAHLCRLVKPFVDNELKMVMVGTWNEFGEGSHIEPTKEWGFSYLDALQSVFFPKAGKHRYKVPSAQELTKLVFADIPAFLEREIEKQGGNLVVNPGFERNWGWVYYDETPVIYETKFTHSGKRSLVIPKEKDGAKMKVLSPGVPWEGRWINLSPIEQGQKYHVSLWVNGRAKVVSALFDKDLRWLNRYQFIAEGGQKGKWRKLEGEFSLPDSEVAFFNVEIAGLDKIVYVDDVEVMRKY